MPTRFTDPEPVARRFDRRRDWDAAREAAFNQSITNQTLLACALRNLLTAEQLEHDGPVSIRLRQAEIETVRVLQMVGGPAATPASGPIGRYVTVHADQPYQVVSQQGGEHTGAANNRSERQGGAGPSDAPATSQEAS